MYNHLGVKRAQCNVWDSIMGREIPMDIVLKSSCTWIEYGKLARVRRDLYPVTCTWLPFITYTEREAVV